MSNRRDFIIYAILNTLENLEILCGYLDIPENAQRASKYIGCDISEFIPLYISSLSTDALEQRNQNARR